MKNKRVWKVTGHRSGNGELVVVLFLAYDL
jgi:hypothetical protein